MKYLKFFNNNKPKLNDYVIVSVKPRYNNFKPMYVIGKIFSIIDDLTPITYMVKYTLPDDHTFNEFFSISDFKAHSKNKNKMQEKLQELLDQNKYNL